MKKLIIKTDDGEHYEVRYPNMMEVKINFNEKVKFKLSERGKEMYGYEYGGLEPKLDVVNPLDIIYESEDE